MIVVTKLLMEMVLNAIIFNFLFLLFLEAGS